MPRRKEPKIPDAILDQLLAGADPKTAFDPSGLLDDLKKALAERALNAEMDHHLAGDGGVSNSRNGYGRKNVITGTGNARFGRTCREFRVWAGMMGAKEPRHATTQRAQDPRRHP